ncbi:MAG TPA: UDP-N-acetylmuramoyl-tripeptide--D-alanyl-D-alanine ligase [Pyrinomonadaceae bacterium]|nr:UDP-N-acetylmuramoyl-tripeptide--D-alanyl-D-alanine ligase [Pyrinomonadaceae bacterium]
MDIKTAASLMSATTDSLRAEFFDKEIIDFSIDSRTAGEGELFFALSQPDYERAGFNGIFADAHDFISQALASGAIAAVARRERVAGDEKLQALGNRLLLVDDVIAALQTLARKVYEQWARPVVGITGSAGKTTTKELTAHVLAVTGSRILKSERNYNNGLGLPLSVLQMVSRGHKPDDYDLAVLEMGMSSPTHEIRRLVQITPPDIGVELLVAPVHLEHLGTIENVAAMKAELIEGLKPGGIAILNADDELVMEMKSKTDGPVLTFGIQNQADVAATDIDTARFGSIRFRLKTPLGEAAAELPMTGRHNLMNALAASAVATALKVKPELIANALRTAKPPRMRGEVLEFAAGFTVVDDSYNSNPRSLLGMVRTLAEASEKVQRRVVIAGEMMELGPDAPEMHRQAGREIAELGIDVLWGVRGLAAEIVSGAAEKGIAETAFFESSDDAAAAAIAAAREGDLILVKGSRSVETDWVVQALKDRFPLAGENREQ